MCVQDDTTQKNHLFLVEEQFSQPPAHSCNLSRHTGQRTSTWAAYINMFEILLKHQKHLEQTVADDDFSPLAKQHNVDWKVNQRCLRLKDNRPRLFTCCQVGKGSPHPWRYMPMWQTTSTVYKTVRDPKFWKAAQQYVNLNKPIAAVITNLSGDSVCLSL
jgi:hypothetical protein